MCFGSLMNIDKLIPDFTRQFPSSSFGSLMNIDKLIPELLGVKEATVLAL